MGQTFRTYINFLITYRSGKVVIPTNDLESINHYNCNGITQEKTIIVMGWALFEKRNRWGKGRDSD